MPPDTEPSNSKPNWTFRVFVLLGAIVLFGSIGFLIWAAVQFGPTSDDEVLQALLLDDMFAPRELLLTRRNSDCNTGGMAKGNVEAALFGAYLEANSQAEPDPVALLTLNPRQRVLDSSKTPQEWYREEGRPVISISNIGRLDRDALVCVEVFSRFSSSYLVKLYRRAATAWDVKEEFLVFQESRPRQAEEIPQSSITEVDY